MNEKHVILSVQTSLFTDGHVAQILTRTTSNTKTGDLPTTFYIEWDMVEDRPIFPTETVNNKNQETVCGDCPLTKQNGGGCYVITAFLAKYQKAVHYHDLSEEEQGMVRAELAYKGVRLGGWGDPYATLESTLQFREEYPTKNHVGYTHHWMKENGKKLARDCMASVHTVEEKEQANGLGFRTYRTIEDEANLEADEILCPHIKNPLIQCKDCGLCAGNSIKAKNIAVLSHGSNKSKLLRLSA